MKEVEADRLAAWATGLGVGLIGLMLTWLIGDRIAEMLWGSPTGPIVAFTAAIVVGTISTVVAGRRLSRSSEQEGELRDP
jgi:hypothetical protein